MRLSRAGFLKSLVLGGAGLIVGEEALERYARLTHVRKSFPSADLTPCKGFVRHTLNLPEGERIELLHVSPSDGRTYLFTTGRVWTLEKWEGEFITHEIGTKKHPARLYMGEAFWIDGARETTLHWSNQEWSLHDANVRLS